VVILTARKATHLRREEGRQKRGGGVEVVSETAAGPDEASVLEQVLSREPDPAFAAQAAEEHLTPLDRLRDGELKAVALWRMEGYSVEEIAQRLGCVVRSIKRKVRVIRDFW